MFHVVIHCTLCCF